MKTKTKTQKPKPEPLSKELFLLVGNMRRVSERMMRHSDPTMFRKGCELLGASRIALNWLDDVVKLEAKR